MDTLINFTDINALMKSPPPVLLSIAIWAVLQAVKQIKGFRTELLPLISLTLGGIGYPVLTGFHAAIVLQGILIGALPTAVDQVFRQRAKAASDEKPTEIGNSKGPSSLLIFLTILGGSLLMGQLMLFLLLSFGCASPSPKPIPGPVVIAPIEIPPSSAGVLQAAHALTVSAEISVKEALRSQPGLAGEFSAIPGKLESLAAAGMSDTASIKSAIAPTGTLPLHDAITLYDYWNHHATFQDATNLIFAIASGVRAGLGKQ